MENKSEELNPPSLLRCPFCGGEADVACGSIMGPARWVECEDCGAEGATQMSNESAAAAWNHRAKMSEDLEWSLRRALEDETAAMWVLEMGIDQDRWIPVTERLPEREGLYLVCGRNKVWIDEWVGPPDRSFVALAPIVAWMPLPEPYEEEK